uniref:Uncharacterized protein n=1 Tax=Alexandrium catenella TaxID=2925 RepID=A0A7S1W1J0_ALECA|mmetsp:Transcript_35622/g.96621  ORF Transcript_35622/g.96621 Transcript_35622/m.96621 type:complete len:427 (+) Transcript_35622:48-1328(+)
MAPLSSNAAALLAFGLLASLADAARVVRAAHEKHQSSTARLGAGKAKTPSYGAAGCECIGIDWPNATLMVDIGDDKVWYPRSMGSSCQAWDSERHPDCEGKHPAPWCEKSWCFVDGCSCNLTTVPKTSSYLPDASSQGSRIYYSYATCGETDEWTAEEHAGACVNQLDKAGCKKMNKCTWAGKMGCVGREVAKGCKAKKSEKRFGDSGCKCLGFANLTGTITVAIKERKYEYPAGFGSHCSAWDDDRHPSCKGDDADAWCKDSWCYVDPCSCDLDVTPKKLTYAPGATYQGKPLFYSYAACGAKDSFSSAENANACPNFVSESKCKKHGHCAWFSSKCVHKDLKEVCSSSPKSAAIVKDSEHDEQEEESEPEAEPEPEPESKEAREPKEAAEPKEASKKGHAKSGAAALSFGLPVLAAACYLALRP